MTRIARVRHAMVAVLALVALGLTPAAGQVILNEYNGVRNDGSAEGGNPEFLADDGSDVFFGRIAGNGGDWFELVVVGDGTAGSTVDMRGWEISFAIHKQVPSGNPAGTLQLSDDAYWADVQAGTILTFSEDASAESGAFDLSSEVHKTENFATLGYAWSHFWIGDGNYLDTPGTNSSLDIMGDLGENEESHDDMAVTISDNASTVVFGPVGEEVYMGGGINSQEVFALEDDPSTSVEPDAGEWEDHRYSDFGAPNRISSGTQDFSAFRVGTIGNIWDDPATPGQQEGGAGTWTIGTTGFRDPDTETNPAFAAGDSVTFGAGGAGSAIVTLDDVNGPIRVDDLAFENGMVYTLTGDKLTATGDVFVNNDGIIASTVEFQDSAGADTEVLTTAEATLEISGPLSGSDGFDVAGTGTVKLSGANAGYGGGIDVTDTAVLDVRGTLHTTSGETVQVKKQATLNVHSTGTVGNVLVDSGSDPLVTGAGTIDGDLTMTDGDAKLAGGLTINGTARVVGATISPARDNDADGIPNGNTANTISFNHLQLGTNADFTWQLFDNTTSDRGTDYDALDVAGALSEDAGNPLTSGGEVNIDVELQDSVDVNNAFWSADHSWTLIDVGAGGSNSTAAAMYRVRDVYNEQADQIIGWGPSFTIAIANNDVVLNWNADGARELTWTGLSFLTEPSDTNGTWEKNVSNWTDAVAPKGWGSSPGGEVDSAVFGTDSADEGVGLVTVTLDESGGDVVVNDLRFENNNPHYEIVGQTGSEQLEIQGDIRVKLSAEIDVDVLMTGGPSTVDIGDGDTLTLTGQLSGTAGMRLESRGALHLTADNSAYAGDFEIHDEAKLIVDVHSGSGAVTATGGEVSGGSELTGLGTIGGAVTVTDGDLDIAGSLTFDNASDTAAQIRRARFTPSSDSDADNIPEGNTAGLLTFSDGLVLGENGDYTWQLFSNTDSATGTGGTDWDLIDVIGNLSADGTLVAGSEFMIDVEMRDAVDVTAAYWNTTRQWTIISADTLSIDPALFLLDDLRDTDDSDLETGFASRFSLDVVSNELVLTYTLDVEGDIDGDGDVDADDIDLLYGGLGGSDPLMDLDNDGDVDGDDVDKLVRDILGTEYGDANLDGAVDDDDLDVMRTHWETAGGWATADFNGDGLVAIGDLGMLSAYWGLVGATGASVTPEPASLALLAAGIAAVVRRRRRC